MQEIYGEGSAYLYKYRCMNRGLYGFGLSVEIHYFINFPK
jgi:hypothetical protein